MTTHCPHPRVTRTKELECPACGRTWEPDDGDPVCEGPQDSTSRAARQSLSQVRKILRPRG